MKPTKVFSSKQNPLCILLFLLVFLSNTASAQRENNIWNFGPRVGLNFSMGSPVASTSSMNAYQACATVCDAAGNLLFYSNSDTVWDKSNHVMPNGTGLLAGYHGGLQTATQGAAIIKSLQNPQQYYLFTMESGWLAGNTDGGHLRYSVIDMTLNGGLGGIVPGQKNILIDSELSEKMTVTTGNSCNYWLLTHDRTNTIYHAFKIDVNGVHTIPVVSNSGTTVPMPYTYIEGEMKVSPDRSLVALACGVNDILELADFDATSGIVSNSANIDNYEDVYGLEFSPNSKRLYAGANGIQQFDLSLLPNISAVINSKTLIMSSTVFDYWGFRRGEDNKIYIAGVMSSGALFGSCVSYIDQPDNLGTMCNLVDNIMFIPSYMTTFLGFGNPVVILPSDTAYTSTDTSICGNIVNIKAPDGFDTYLWNDGTAGQTNEIRSSAIKWVYAMNNCHLLIDTFNVHLTSINADLGKDTSICAGDTISFDFDTAGAEYLWNGVPTSPPFYITSAGIYTIKASKDDCNVSDTISVSPKSISISLGNDTTLCNNQELTLSAGIDANYLWQDNSSSKEFVVTKPGVYWAQVSEGSCVASDTIQVNYEICDCVAGIPTAFTPNGDGKNDYFRPIINCSVSDYHLNIFNRWGQLIFEASSINDKWNGTFGAVPVDIGTYFYSLSFTGPNGNVYSYKGDITVIK